MAKSALGSLFSCILLLLVLFESNLLPAGERYSLAHSLETVKPGNVDNIQKPGIAASHTPTNKNQPSYIGTHACGNCHSDKYRSFLRTAHHLTSQPPNSKSIAGSFTPQRNVLRTRNRDVWFEMSKGGDGFYQTGYTRTNDGVRRQTERIDISVGSGKLGQTYLYWKGNQLFQLPISYFTSNDRWINSPGYTDGEVNFDRPIVPRCLECHATYFGGAAHHSNTYDKDNFILGISCERCHGPGSDHQENQIRYPEAVGTPYILNPRKLEPQRKNEICAQCHSGRGNPLTPPFSFKPGEPLDEHIKLASHFDQNRLGVHSVNQLARLSKSKCFNESVGMSCISCHDPHILERGKKELFSSRCLNCHEAHDCGMASQLGDSIQKDCISCHMPHLKDQETGMETANTTEFPLMAEHLIAIYPDVTQLVINRKISPLKETLRIKASQVEPVQDLPEIPANLAQQLESFAPERRQLLQRDYERILANPNDSQANGDLGMAFHAFKRYALASTFYERAHLLEPKSFRWAYYWGIVRGSSGQTTEAIAILRKAIALDPNYLAARLKLADFLFTTGDWEKCTEIYKLVLNRYPDNAVAYYGLGRVEAGEGNLSAAAEHYRKACRLLPSFAAAHYALAIVYRSLGELAKSEEHLGLFNRNKETRSPLEDPSINPLMEPLKRLASNAQYHFQKGLRFQKQGQLQRAISEFELTLEEDPQFMPAHVNLIRAYGALGQFDKAEQKYYTAIEAAPNMFEVHHNFGVLRKLQGRKKEAAEVFKKVLEINPFWAESHYQLATLLVAEGRLADAERHCRMAIENKPSFRDAHFTLGWILQQQGKNTEAIPEFLKTIKVKDRQTPGFMFLLSVSYARIGNIERALYYAKESKRQAITFGQTSLVTSIATLLNLLEPIGVQ